MAVDRLAKAVPFPEWAPDHVLRFTTADLIALEDHCRLDLPEVTPEALAKLPREVIDIPWTRVLERRFAANDPRFIQTAVKLGVKKPGGHDRPEIKATDLADLPFAPAEIVRKLADAIMCAITGRAYADVLAEREVAEQEAAKAAA